MKALLYTLLFLIVVTAECGYYKSIEIIFQHPHKYAFYFGVAAVIAFILLNAELVKKGLEIIKEQ